jgi:hypothetical protein
MADKELEYIAPTVEVKPSKQDKLEYFAPEKETNPYIEQGIKGFKESIPFVNLNKDEAMYEMPKTFTERFTRKFAQNLPLDVAIGSLGGLPGIGLGTAAAATSAAAGATGETLGLPKLLTTGLEIGGGFVPGVARTIAGKTVGFIEPQLENLYQKGKKFFEVGPGARSQKGMKYGAGETEEAAVRNLNKFTEEATSRTGFKTNNIDGNWLKNTGKGLIDEVDGIFKGKTFTADNQFITDINTIANKAEGAFGEQGNIIRTILESNIQGARPRGSLVSSSFDAQDLRKAIIEVNNRLDGVTNTNQAMLLHDLKDALENLASKNLQRFDPKLKNQYDLWKNKYTNYATIRDAYAREGDMGITAAGQINPKKLLDVIAIRTGGNVARNPLYQNLAEFGPILKVKQFPDTGVIKATGQYFGESPLSKALQTGLQPRVLSRKGAAAVRALPFTGVARDISQSMVTPEDVQTLEYIK